MAWWLQGQRHLAGGRREIVEHQLLVLDSGHFNTHAVLKVHDDDLAGHDDGRVTCAELVRDANDMPEANALLHEQLHAFDLHQVSHDVQIGLDVIDHVLVDFVHRNFIVYRFGLCRSTERENFALRDPNLKT